MIDIDLAFNNFKGKFESMTDQEQINYLESMGLEIDKKAILRRRPTGAQHVLRRRSVIKRKGVMPAVRKKLVSVK